MNRALFQILADAGMEEAAEFLRTNKTWIYSRKKT